MKQDHLYQPEFNSIKNLLLDMAQERSIDRLLDMIVTRMTKRPHIVLTGIWLFEERQNCALCSFKDRCSDQERCLQLAAMDIKQNKAKTRTLDYLKNRLEHYPVDVGKIGSIASSGEAGIRLLDVHHDPDWDLIRSWSKQEQSLYFAGQPLVYKDQVLGVLGLFSRINQVSEGHIWLRMIANHFAIAVANARAFEEIESLKRQLENENEFLRHELRDYKNHSGIIGQSGALSNTLQQIELVAPTDVGVLVLGESGTGKELVAREIHAKSLRAKAPLIMVNCASIPDTLYESEFFGHIKGAFTGAVKDRAGRFETANGGTLLLDEIGEIPLDMQAKLLRVLQEGLYERVGEDITRKTDVRIIASTNKNLKHEVEKKRFRQDLYYRLNVFPIKIAPLRERKEDIPLLANHFMELLTRKLNKPKLKITGKTIQELQDYSWPGNIRELQNIIERAVILSIHNKLTLSMPWKEEQRIKNRKKNASLEESDDVTAIIPDQEMKDQQRQNILIALRKSRGKIYGSDGAANLLKLKPTTLSYRIKKLAIEKKEIYQ
ncbi:sigma 54-interacting transcriptional regulator [bacterium]|nr:sigma 54-interacting transcriptional regulator [bacterium]